jgi:hypothetical protein
MQDGRSVFSLGLSISLTALVLGCGGAPAHLDTAKTDTLPAKTDTSPAAPARSEEATNAGGEEGDGDAEKKPALSFAALRTAVLACPVDDSGEIDTSCPGYDQWFDSEAPAFEGGKANGDLLKMLGSQDAKERRLATERLRSTLVDHLDAKTADSVLDAAEKERDETVAKWMALLVGEQPLAKVGKLDRAITIAKAHPLAVYTEDFLFNAAGENRDPKLFAYAQEASKSKNSALRNAAIEVFTKFAADVPAEACQALDGYRTETDSFTRDRAIYNMAGLGQCAPYAGKVIDYLGKVELKKGLGFTVGQTLKLFCSRAEPTPAQKERLNKAARRIVEAKDVSGTTRGYALEAVVGCDPKGGPAFAAKFKNDPNKDLASEAAKLAK